MKKFFLCLSVFIYIFSYSFASSNNNTQIIQSGHWVYDALETLQSEIKQPFFTQNQPMSIGQMKFHFNKIDENSLSDSGKKLYQKIENFLYHSDDFLPTQDLRLFANLTASPEIYLKSNENIPLSFDYYLNNRFLTIPILFGFSDYITIQSDFFVAKNYSAIHENSNFTNIPYASNHFDFYFPTFSYGSTGLFFENWGVSFHAGKQGMQLGNTKLGSIVYNNYNKPEKWTKNS